MARVFGYRILEELGRRVTNSELYYSDFRSWEVMIKFGQGISLTEWEIYSRDSNQKQRSYDFFVLTETLYSMGDFNEWRPVENVTMSYVPVDEWMDKYVVSRGVAIMMKLLYEGMGVSFLDSFVTNISVEGLLLVMYKRGILD